MYVGKIAFYGWALHFSESEDSYQFFMTEFLYTFFPLLAPFLIMGRVTYLHHYVCLVYFALLQI